MLKLVNEIEVGVLMAKTFDFSSILFETTPAVKNLIYVSHKDI